MNNFILFFFFFSNVELFYLSHKLVDLYPSTPVSKYKLFFLIVIFSYLNFKKILN